MWQRWMKCPRYNSPAQHAAQLKTARPDGAGFVTGIGE
jgi:hypothetical protein